MTFTMDRVAAAPISWGISEVPGWGHQMAFTSVLSEMAELGLRATELGPEGFLPAAVDDQAAVLSEFELEPVAQFVPVVLHGEEEPAIGEAIARLTRLGAGTLILAAASGRSGYDTRPDLDDDAWDRMLRRLDELMGHAAAFGIRVVLHPHVGTMVETDEDVQRVLDDCQIPICLDTGHLMVGGTDPLELAVQHADRVAHVHLKDVRRDLAEAVRSGGTAYADAVADGMYVPLGRGDVDIAGIVRELEDAAYPGWYVLEQDTMLPEPSAQTARPQADVHACLEFLRARAESSS